jgi:peroxiredoxin
LRENISTLTATGASIVAIAPHSHDELVKHLKTNSYPFTVLADPEGGVFAAYDVTSRMISLGQQPAMFIVDDKGIVRFDAIGDQQWDLISPKQLAKLLADLPK